MGRLHRRRLVQSAKTITSLSFDIFLPLRWTNHICKASLRDLWIPPKVHLQTPWKGRHLDLVGPMTQACLKQKKTEIQWQSKKSKYFLLFHVFKCLLYFEGLFFSPTHFIWKKNFFKYYWACLSPDHLLHALVNNYIPFSYWPLKRGW